MAEFVKKLTLTGGGAEQLNALILANGYNMSMSWTLVVRASRTNTASIFVGSFSNVDASTGFELEPGDVYPISGDRPSPIQPTQYYFYAAAPQGLEVWMHG